MWRGVFAIALAGALVMCANALSVRVETAPEFVPAHTVSVFGVFHDGRMSEPAWTALSPKISSALGKAECELGYGNRLRNGDPELASWLERNVRENGIDDTVLDKIAPYAEGDLVMVLLSYRKLPGSRDAGVRVRAAQPMAMGRGMARPRGSYAPPEDDHVFELSASLFSPKEHKLVAQIDLRYAGDDLDEAMGQFTAKLRGLVPGAKCAGWNWPNPDEIADAGEPE